jgi:hypothetical protein
LDDAVTDVSFRIFHLKALFLINGIADIFGQQIVDFQTYLKVSRKAPVVVKI